jgi:hypothetical protein
MMNIAPQNTGLPQPAPAGVGGATADSAAPAAAGQGAAPQPVGGLQGVGGLRQLAESTLEHIAGYLPPRGVGRFAAVAGGTEPALPGPVLAARKAVEAEAVSTPHAFLQLLGAAGQGANAQNGIRSLHPSLQASPLAALALRIRSMPPGDVQGVIPHFLAAFEALPEQHRSAALTALAHVAEHSTAGFGAHAAARHGANVQHTALFYGIVDETQIVYLEQLAALSSEPRSAGAAARRGEDLRAIASEFGIASEGARAMLEQSAAMSRQPGSAGAAAQSGQNVQAVATNFGISSPNAVYSLEFAAATSDAPGSAGHAVRTGTSVEEACAAFGITTNLGITVLQSVANIAQHAPQP